MALVQQTPRVAARPRPAQRVSHPSARYTSSSASWARTPVRGAELALCLLAIALFLVMAAGINASGHQQRACIAATGTHCSMK